jgi:hypothetical protein
VGMKTLQRFKNWLSPDLRQGHLTWDPEEVSQPVCEDAAKPVYHWENPKHHDMTIAQHKGDHSGSVFDAKDHASMALHAETFDTDHARTISEYKEMSSRINVPLRTGHHPDRPEKIGDGWEHKKWINKDAHAHYVNDLDHITNHALPRDHVAFRGATRRWNLEKMPPGHEFIDHGFTGTSHDPKIGADFSHRADWGATRGKYHLFRVHMPAGTKAYHMDRHENDFDTEKETLLARGTKFRVGDHHSYRDAHVVDLHVVSQGHELK